MSSGFGFNRSYPKTILGSEEEMLPGNGLENPRRSAKSVAPDHSGAYHIDMKEVELLKIFLDFEHSLEENRPSCYL